MSKVEKRTHAPRELVPIIAKVCDLILTVSHLIKEGTQPTYTAIQIPLQLHRCLHRIPFQPRGCLQWSKVRCT